MYYIGVDIGGMSIKCGLVDDGGNILNRARIVTPLGDVEALAEAVCTVVKEVSEKVRPDEIVGVGIGVPGVVDSTGDVKFASNLVREAFPFGDILTDKLNMKVVLANDADCAALGEVEVGSAKGISDVVMVTIGTGVGGGIIAGGKLFSGASGLGGEIGHISAGGSEPCTCGRRGCLETVVSATALMRRTDEYIKRYPDSELGKIKAEDGKTTGMTVFKAMDRGDEVAKKLYAEYLFDLGEGLVNLANIFRPKVILIGGGISAEGDKLTKPLQAHMDKYVYGGDRVSRVEIRCASLGNDAGIIGAAFLVK